MTKRVRAEFEDVTYVHPTGGVIDFDLMLEQVEAIVTRPTASNDFWSTKEDGLCSKGQADAALYFGLDHRGIDEWTRENLCCVTLGEVAWWLGYRLEGCDDSDEMCEELSYDTDDLFQEQILAEMLGLTS